jgi:hypothetical protein
MGIEEPGAGEGHGRSADPGVGAPAGSHVP